MPDHPLDPRLRPAARRRRVLARRREAPDAAAHLRDGVGVPQGAGRAPRAARGGAQARPPQARARAGPGELPRGARPRPRRLAPQRRDRPPGDGGLHPRRGPPPRLPAGLLAARRARRSCSRPRATSSSTPRGCSRRWVRARRRARGLLRQADELPVPRADLPVAHAQLPRAAAAAGGARDRVPLRALRRRARAPARPRLHPGRQPHLLHRGPAGRGGHGCIAVRARRLRDVRLHRGPSRIALSTRPAKAATVGTDEGWAHAEAALHQALRARSGLDYVVDEGEGAFYGPKIDLQVTDAIGRAWQLTTVQVDFNHPRALRPRATRGPTAPSTGRYMVHRALLRLHRPLLRHPVEHYNGAFPTWLAPIAGRRDPDRRHPRRVRGAGRAGRCARRRPARRGRRLRRVHGRPHPQAPARAACPTS